jgi:hypothetical protein
MYILWRRWVSDRCPYGRAIAKIVWTTLECDSQRAASLSLWEAQYNSILITLLRTMLHQLFFSPG